jgi:hypothetical protein
LFRRIFVFTIIDFRKRIEREQDVGGNGLFIRSWSGIPSLSGEKRKERALNIFIFKNNKMMKSKWTTAFAMGVTAFVVYLLMRKYAFGDQIESKDYIVAGAVAIGLIVGQIIMNRKK